MDNVFIEPRWRSLKREQLRLWSDATVAEVTAGIDKWMDFDSPRRKHQSLDGETPWSHDRPGSTKTGRETLNRISHTRSTATACGPLPFRSGPNFPWTGCFHTVQREPPGGKSGLRLTRAGPRGVS